MIAPTPAVVMERLDASHTVHRRYEPGDRAAFLAGNAVGGLP